MVWKRVRTMAISPKSCDRKTGPGYFEAVLTHSRKGSGKPEPKKKASEAAAPIFRDADHAAMSNRRARNTQEPENGKTSPTFRDRVYNRAGNHSTAATSDLGPSFCNWLLQYAQLNVSRLSGGDAKPTSFEPRNAGR